METALLHDDHTHGDVSCVVTDEANTNSNSSNSSNSGQLAITATAGLPKKPCCSAKAVVAGKQIPVEILENVELQTWISLLPENYNFELYKTIWRIQQANAKRVALQFPEGLLRFSLPIGDIITRFTGAEIIILGDVTYGACCIDDFAAKALGCDFLVHYGHSCLVSIRDCLMSSNILYVFVEIAIDLDHFVKVVCKNFEPQCQIALIGTVQFLGSVRAAAEKLTQHHFVNPVIVPQSKPLSSGEILGCTAPTMETTINIDAVISLADGRFHLEAFMIANPSIKSYRYDPYAKVLTIEAYDSVKMRSLRRCAIEEASRANSFGLILGTLGRQGRPLTLERLERLLKKHNKQYFVLLLSEIFPHKLAMFPNVEAWIQVACPRLSIDWGHSFSKPLLTPYEAEVCLGEAKWADIYPMDYYSKSGGKWAAYTPKD